MYVHIPDEYQKEQYKNKTEINSYLGDDIKGKLLCLALDKGLERVKES